MNKSTLITVLILGLLGWLLFGAFFISSRGCGIDGSTAAAAATGAGSVAAGAVAAKGSCGTWSFNDGNSFQAKANRHYQFNKSSASLIQPTDNSLVGAINQTVSYLSNNSNRKLVITGLYDIDENNNSSASDLGMARATAVLNALKAKGVDVSQMGLESKSTTSNSFTGNRICKGVEFNFVPK